MEELRAQFPVLERVAYLNAGTNGPVPAAALEAAEASLREQVELGRSSKPWFEHQIERIAELRGRVAALFGATPADVAITGSTTDGINAVLHAVDIQPGDEILTSDEEHPGVLAPLATARDSRGARVRVVPFEELPGEVGPDTRFVVCSHVSWATGRVMDTEPLTASDAIVVLDGAQGLGAVPIDARGARLRLLRRLGPEVALRPGRHGLPVRQPRAGARACPRPGPATTRSRTPSAGSTRRCGRTRADSEPAFPCRTTWSGRTRPSTCSSRPGSTASTSAASRRRIGSRRCCGEQGVTVAPRGATTLVSFEVPDPPAFTEQAAAEGLVIRGIPGRQLARASVGAWNSERRDRATRRSSRG